MSIRRRYLRLVAMGCACVVLTGACQSWLGPAGGTWEAATGSMHIARGGPIAATLADGRVLVLGGTQFGEGGYAEVFNPLTGTFSLVDSMKLPDLNAHAVVLRDGQVLIAGADMSEPMSDDDRTPRPSRWSYLFNPSTGQYQQTGPMTQDRADASVTLLPDGRVLVAGGCYNCHAFYRQGWESAEIFDPRTRTYTATGPMVVSRGGHSATLMADGRVFIIGGQREAEAEIFDPKTGEFSSAGMPLSRNIWQTAFGLRDGRVLILAALAMYKEEDGPLAELYDPVSGTFSATGELRIARNSPDAVMLPDGRVLVLGGHAGDRLVPEVEVYSPSAGTFRVVGSLKQARACSAVVPLDRWRVLLVGGCADPSGSGGSWYLDTAEILTIP